MKLVTAHTVTFSVQYFAGYESGMDCGYFGEECGDIGAAIQLLQLARAAEKGRDWVIVFDVRTAVAATAE